MPSVQNVLFYPKNEVKSYLKIEIKWDVLVYIKSDEVIWFWQYCHVRTCQTSEKYITDCKCVVQTNSQVASPTTEWVNFIFWSWYFLALSFHALYSICWNLRKWFVSQNMDPLSLRSRSRGVLTAQVMMNMLAIKQFFPKAGNWRINLWNWYSSHFARNVRAVIV